MSCRTLKWFYSMNLRLPYVSYGNIILTSVESSRFNDCEASDLLRSYFIILLLLPIAADRFYKSIFG